MRHVFPTDEIFHLWAHQTQEDARNNSNVHFNGVRLYSYSTMIACLVDNIAYISSDSMSSTTARHISAARQATRHMDQFSTPAFTRWGSDPRPTHADMIAPAVRDALETLERALAAPRTRQATKQAAIHTYLSRRSEIIALAEQTGTHVAEMPIIDATADATAAYKQQQADIAARKAAADLKAAKKQQTKDKHDFKNWLTTGAGQCPYSYSRTGTDYITIKGDYVTYRNQKDHPDQEINAPVLQVITSQGATAPLDHVIKALRFYDSRLLPMEADYRPYHTNGHKIALGHFTLDSIDEAGTVKAGCHTFTAAEIARFRAQWTTILQEVKP